MEYTLALSVAAIVALIIDWLSGIRLVRRRTFWIFLAVMYAFMIPVNGYLTWRPIVIYAAEHHLGPRVFTMPVEDFLFGFSVMMTTLLVWEGRKEGWRLKASDLESGRPEGRLEKRDGEARRKRTGVGSQRSEVGNRKTEARKQRWHLNLFGIWRLVSWYFGDPLCNSAVLNWGGRKSGDDLPKPGRISLERLSNAQSLPSSMRRG